jgi:hypothetical protein
VLNGVRVVRTSGFKNLLEVVFQWSGALIETMLGCRYELLIGVLDPLPDVAVVHRHGEMTRAALLRLFATRSALFGASDGDTGGCGSATTSGRTCFNQSEGRPESLFYRGVSGCDVEQLLGSFWLLTAELLNQRAARSAVLEGQDDIGIGHTRSS